MSERGWLEILEEVEASLALLDEVSATDADPSDPDGDLTGAGNGPTVDGHAPGSPNPLAASVDPDEVAMMAAAWRPPADPGPIPQDQFMRATRLLTQLRGSLERAASKQLEIEEELAEIDRRRQAGAAYLQGI